MSGQYVVTSIPTFVVVHDTATGAVVQQTPGTSTTNVLTQAIVVDSRTQRLIEAGVQGPPGPQGVAGPEGGTSTTFVAAQALGGHRVVRTTSADTVDYASQDNPAHGDDTVGVTMGAAVMGAFIEVQRSGPITFNGWSWTSGEPVFLATNGVLTQTAPSTGFVQVIGHAAAADTLYLHIEAPIYLD